MSIKRQTFKDFAITVVNAGSRAGNEILEILEVSKVPAVFISGHKYKDRYTILNKLVRSAASPYVFLLDGDNWVAPTFLEKAYLFLELQQDFFFVNSYVVAVGMQDHQWRGGFHERHLFLKENRNIRCFIARRQVFEKVLFDKYIQENCEDWDFWLQSACEGYWGYTIPEFLISQSELIDRGVWTNLSGKKSLTSVSKSLEAKYGTSLRNRFPNPQFTSFNFQNSLDACKTYEFVQLKKLLCLFPWLEIGGADQFNINLLQGLKERGWSITIVTTLEANHLWQKNFEVITQDIIHLSNLGRSYHYDQFLQHIISTRQPQTLFLSNSMYGYYALPWIKKMFPKLNIVDYLHCEDPGWYNGGYPYFSTLFNNVIDTTLTTSNQLRSWCIEHGILPQKVESAYINIDTFSIRPRPEVRETIRRQFSIKTDQPVILYAARLTAQKQPYVLLNALLQVQFHIPMFHCFIIGDGPEKRFVEQFIKLKGLSPNVTYLGALPNNRVMDFMDAADLFFLPSKYEGIALSIYEAMAKGVAVLGAAVGGQVELVHPNCGVLIEPSTPDVEAKTYALKLQKLLNQPQLLKEMGAAARKRVCTDFDLQQMIDHLEQVLSRDPVKASSIEMNYQTLLNRMMYLEEENAAFFQITQSKLYKLTKKMKAPYLQLKNFFHRTQFSQEIK